MGRHLAIVTPLVIACASPEARPELPDIRPTIFQLEALPARVIAIRESGRQGACRFDISAQCEYPARLPVVQMRDLDPLRAEVRKWR